MDRKWTKDQQKAINSINGTVLVSAAAGSGKTSVLVQRVINQITDPVNRTDIDKFLIVTFTKAAAQEMRMRISGKLSELILKNPENSNLYRQQMMLKYASIGTIHSFCSSIVKENFFKLGMSPKFRIADESEIKLLKGRAMENTLNHFYELKSPEFEAVADLFATEKDDGKLSDIINCIYDFTRSIPFPQRWFDEKLKMYANACACTVTSPWCKVIFEHSYETLSAVEEIINEMLETVNSIESFKAAYSGALKEDLENIKSVKKIFDSEKWDEICSRINSFSFAKLKPLRSENNENEKSIIAYKRKHIKYEIEKLQKYFLFTESETAENINVLNVIVKTLFEITKYFSDEVSSLKLLKNVADFSDLEHKTLDLLAQQSENGIQKSKIAEEISQRYKEIMVDEYQDVNEIQNTIFKMITKNESNIFTVGDVKQSIYKFRQSRPQIFMQKKNNFPHYDEGKNNHPSKIILGQNFRSKEGIIKSINFIFRCLMSEKVGEIDYNDEEILIPGASYSASAEPDVSLKIINVSKVTDGEDGNILEARNISETIIKMIAQGYTVTENKKERPITYSDFCVLLRSSSAHAHIYAQELYKCGIPSWSETNEKFLGTKEISTIVSILKVIDNPVQDVALVSALISPVFGFDTDQLSKIRQTERDIPFYFALKKYAQNGEVKVIDFLEKISRYRQIAGIMPCDELIDQIYHDTDLPAICAAMPKGEIKKANLALFVDYARKFESQYHKGLPGFLNFLESIKRKNSDLSPASISDETENTVKIISIHKSKGLEFPVCILAGCARKFNFDKDSFTIHPELGIGMKLKDKSGTIQYDNFIRQSIALKNKKESISEELRILYVALTRAKQKLIMLASLKDPQKSVQDSIIAAKGAKNAFLHAVETSHSFADWILLCAAKSNLINKLCLILNIPEHVADPENEELEWDIEFISNEKDEIKTDKLQENTGESDSPKISPERLHTRAEDASLNAELAHKISSRFNFKYPGKDFTTLPLKISASQLAKSGEWERYIATSRPAFMSKQKLTPAGRGTAMHKFLCCADFKNISQNGIHSEADLLIKKGFLTCSEAGALDIPALEKFTKCKLFERILKSSEILREYRFSVKIPPAMINQNLPQSENENFIVVQGALDCAFIENGKYAIVDYKTDKTTTTSELFDKYSKQLEIYKYALERTKNAPVEELITYSFYLNDEYIKR